VNGIHVLVSKTERLWFAAISNPQFTKRYHTRMHWKQVMFSWPARLHIHQQPKGQATRAHTSTAERPSNKGTQGATVSAARLLHHTSSMRQRYNKGHIQPSTTRGAKSVKIKLNLGHPHSNHSKLRLDHSLTEYICIDWVELTIKNIWFLLKDYILKSLNRIKQI